MPAQNKDMPPFAPRLALLYGALFLFVGSMMPYFPLWLASRGLEKWEIGIIVSAPLFTRLAFTPAISFLADRLGDRRRVLRVLVWGTLLSLLTLSFLDRFWEILPIALLVGAFWTSVMPLTDTLAMSAVRRLGMDYGKVRLWGSLAFILASFGGGLWIDLWGGSAAMTLILGAAVLMMLSAHALPPPPGRRTAATALPPLRLRDVAALGRSPVFWLFLLAASLVQGAHAVYYAFGTLHWQAQDISAGIIGTLWAVGVVAEIVLFLKGKPLVARFGPLGLLTLAALAAILRWTVTAFDPPLGVLFAVQTLHGLTFGAAHLGAIHFLSDAIPEPYAATAQGLYATFAMGAIMGSAMMASGPLYEALAGKAYLVMAGLGVLSFLCVRALARLWHGGHILASLEDRDPERETLAARS